MSLFNMLHGYEPTAGAVLAILNISAQDVVRFRDAYFTYKDGSEKEPVMVILARTGSTSWTEPDERNQRLQQLPGFIDAKDDEFDTSFALYRFEVPNVNPAEGVKALPLREAVLKYLSEHGRPLTLREKTEQATGPDQTRRQQEALGQIAEKLKRVLGDHQS